MFYFSHYIGNFIIPTDFLFFRRVGSNHQPEDDNHQIADPCSKMIQALWPLSYAGISPKFVWQKENEIVLETRKLGWSKMEKLFDT